MKYFFALTWPGFKLDEAYLQRHRRVLQLRNLAMVVLYGLVVTRVQQEHQALALVLTVFAALHALMIGILFGGGKDES